MSFTLTIKIIILVAYSYIVDGETVYSTKEDVSFYTISGYESKTDCNHDGNKKHQAWLKNSVAGNFSYTCT